MKIIFFVNQFGCGSEPVLGLALTTRRDWYLPRPDNYYNHFIASRKDKAIKRKNIWEIRGCTMR